VTLEVVATGVTLTPADDAEADADGLSIWAQIWVETRDGTGVHRRWGAAGKYDELRLDDEPTKALVEAALDGRDLYLGDLLGHLRIAGDDVTPAEVYFAPFWIELSDELKRRLAGSWRYRDPRLPDAEDPPLPPV
jgi:hypothetical protein